jgi:hypothetical protein
MGRYRTEDAVSGVVYGDVVSHVEWVVSRPGYREILARAGRGHARSVGYNAKRRGISAGTELSIREKKSRSAVAVRALEKLVIDLKRTIGILLVIRMSYT